MRMAFLLALTGCSSILGIEDFKVGDAGGGGEMIEAGFCLGPAGWKICVPQEPTAAQTFDSPVSFSTTNNSRCLDVQPASWKTAGQPDACIIVGKTISVTAEVPFAGNRPLVLFAADSITIAGGSLDLSSQAQPPQLGAASPGDTCKAVGAATQAGGGAGGSFMTRGGSGGTGSLSGSTAGIAQEPDTARPTKLRAGCNGGIGANGSGTTGGSAGRGGGAVYLVAGNRISINGNATINASGSPGGPGGQGAGGGGAGTGGMIVLVAPVITGENGFVVANGGGGGGGGGNMAGAIGGEPVATTPLTVARGGSGGGGGGSGGDGFAGSMLARPGTNGALTTATGGGGGGGGGGYVVTSVTPTGIMFSPSPMAPN